MASPPVAKQFSRLQASELNCTSYRDFSPFPLATASRFPFINKSTSQSTKRMPTRVCIDSIPPPVRQSLWNQLMSPIKMPRAEEAKYIAVIGCLPPIDVTRMPRNKRIVAWFYRFLARIMKTVVVNPIKDDMHNLIY